jgi:dihydroorotate dehydrogenase
VGGEVRGELLIRAQSFSNDRIRVFVDTWLYEGTSEATRDLDGQNHFNFILYPNNTVNKSYTVYNTAENDEDYVKVNFSCTNVPA